MLKASLTEGQRRLGRKTSSGKRNWWPISKKKYVFWKQFKEAFLATV